MRTLPHQILGDAIPKPTLCSDLDPRWSDMGLTLPTSASPQQPNIIKHSILTPLLQPLLDGDGRLERERRQHRYLDGDRRYLTCRA
ncbi:hypothetical protein HanIR_Chr02g0083171 [Helianthus annuus]|nr:hypothetical protein HanIR_Chr02g0083171 [Helianthus annuus]